MDLLGVCLPIGLDAQEQWIAPATWKRTILAWMGWTMTCFTLMTLDLQVSLVRWLQLAFSHRTSPTAAFWGGFNYSPSHTAVVPVSGILSSRTRQLKHSAHPLPVRMLCCLVESLKSHGDSSMGVLVTVYMSLQLALCWIRSSRRTLRKVSGKHVLRCRSHGSCSALPTSSTGSTYSGISRTEIKCGGSFFSSYTTWP